MVVLSDFRFCCCLRLQESPSRVLAHRSLLFGHGILGSIQCRQGLLDFLSAPSNCQQAVLMKTSFTIPEIRKYLEGHILHDGNGEESANYNLALRGAIAFIGEREDGIRGFLAREKWRIEKKSLDRFAGVPCALIAGGCSGLIEKVENKKRKLLVNIGSRKFWISTKTFFDKWYWGPRCEVGKETQS